MNSYFLRLPRADPTLDTINKLRSEASLNKIKAYVIKLQQQLNEGKDVEPELELEADVVAGVRALLRAAHTITANLPMSDAASKRLYRLALAMFVHFGLPAFFITINPADIYSMLVVHFATAFSDPVSMTSLLEDMQIRTKLERLQHVARDPGASAEFAHRLMRCFIKHLLGWSENPDERTCGLFGTVLALLFNEEGQNRGSLHFHGFIWLEKAVNDLEFRELIKTAEFRSRFIAFIDDIIKCCLPRTPEEQQLVPANQQLVQANAVKLPEQLPDGLATLTAAAADADNHLCKPSQCLSDNPLNKFVDLLMVLLKSNMHNPQHTATCSKRLHKKKEDLLKTDCRFGFPKKLHAETTIDPTNSMMTLRRDNLWLNQMNYWLSSLLRCNTDIQQLLLSPDPVGLVHYIFKYVCKQEISGHNMYAVVFRALAIAQQYDEPTSDEHLSARRLAMKAASQLNTCTPISGPQIFSRLKRLPKVYQSHMSAILHLHFFLRALKEAAKQREQQAGNAVDSTTTDLDTQPVSDEHVDTASAMHEQAEQPAAPDESEEFVISTRKGKSVTVCNQRIDYLHRPHALENICLQEYVARFVKRSKQNRHEESKSTNVSAGTYNCTCDEHITYALFDAYFDNNNTV